MTDEEIEKTLRRNADNIGGGFDSRVLDYINRLKAEKKRIKHNWDIAVSVQRAKWQAKCEQVHKDTAKEILQEVEMHSICRLRADGYKEYTISELALNEIFDKFGGVEVDDNV